MMQAELDRQEIGVLISILNTKLSGNSSDPVADLYRITRNISEKR